MKGWLLAWCFLRQNKSCPGLNPLYEAHYSLSVKNKLSSVLKSLWINRFEVITGNNGQMIQCWEPLGWECRRLFLPIDGTVCAGEIWTSCLTGEIHDKLGFLSAHQPESHLSWYLSPVGRIFNNLTHKKDQIIDIIVNTHHNFSWDAALNFTGNSNLDIW